MAADREKIKSLLGLNLPNNVVASAVGVSDSYIAQLLSEEEFAKEVSELRVKNMSEGAERDGKYNKIEDDLLTKLEQIVENPLFGVTNPGLILNAIRVVNAAKRRTTPSELSGISQRAVVPLTLPAIIIQNFVVNSKNQVVQVGERSIATMPASAVVKQLEELRKNGTGVENQDQHVMDAEKAEKRVRDLVKLQFLPVHELV